MSDAQLAAWIKYLQEKLAQYNALAQAFGTAAQAAAAAGGGPVNVSFGPVSFPSKILTWLQGLIGQQFNPQQATASQLAKASAAMAGLAAQLQAQLDAAQDEELCRSFPAPGNPGNPPGGRGNPGPNRGGRIQVE
jgi:hypothetical protein